jgi:serine/threonine protein kinase
MAILPPPNPSQSHLQADPYSGLSVIGIGMTGLILKLDENRVVKIAKVYPLDDYVGKARGDMEYINEINRETLQNERNIYDRLGNHKGIISCLKSSDYGIELDFANQGDLETYIESTPDPPDSFKIEWILSLTDTLSYIHSRRVFVDEIALRNILVRDGQLKLADFGQSVLLPLTADIDTICENHLTAKTEILHIGWIIYSITVWRIHKYYFFDPKNSSQDLPSTDHLFCGSIIEKCWNGEYVSMNVVNEEARALLGDRSRVQIQLQLHTDGNW